MHKFVLIEFFFVNWIKKNLLNNNNKVLRLRFRLFKVNNIVIQYQAQAERNLKVNKKKAFFKMTFSSSNEYLEDSL